jgi:hypothetical protein
MDLVAAVLGTLFLAFAGGFCVGYAIRQSGLIRD